MRACMQDAGLASRGVHVTDPRVTEWLGRRAEWSPLHVHVHGTPRQWGGWVRRMATAPAAWVVKAREEPAAHTVAGAVHACVRVAFKDKWLQRQRPHGRWQQNPINVLLHHAPCIAMPRPRRDGGGGSFAPASFSVLAQGLAWAARLLVP